MKKSINAQSVNDYLELTREVLKAEKKAAITEAMQLTDPESQPFWNLYNEYQAALYPVQNKRYYTKFKKVLSPGKAARFMQLENKIETLIDAQLALEIPLIETK